MNSITIDIETFSSADLSKAGVYRYAEAPGFKVLLFGYSVDGGPVEVVDLEHGETIPDSIIAALADSAVVKWAFNASFERICLSRMLGLPTGAYLDPAQWRCSMVWAATLGLPQSLEGAGAILGLSKKKLAEGKNLIKRYCVPGKAMTYFCDPKWKDFVEYNRRDVEAEMQIKEKLAKFPVPDEVWEQYRIDQEINDRGVLLDMELVRQALAFDGISRSRLTSEMKKLTALENPNSVVQMKQWLAENGIEAETLGRKAVAELLKSAPEGLRDPLRLRLQLAKSSVKKYAAMQNAVCADERARGMFRFYGAARTGRWSGKLIQMQNLRRNDMRDLAEARELVRSGDYEMTDSLYGDVPDVLSQLVRTAFIAPPGKKLIVADFAAIEARVLAWLAGEGWRMDAFAGGADIYCASASQMFGVPVEKHGVNGHLRQKGKIAELALGYGGSVGALKAMGAIEMDLGEDELPGLVSSWRDANPAIVQFWWDVDEAVKLAVKRKASSTVRSIGFECRSGMLFITLPSGRKLSYPKPRMGENRFGGESVTYEGVGVTKKWERIESYGPKFVENIVQAVSRDLLACAMMRLRERRIVMHIHDELVIEASETDSLEEICRIMAETPPWADGLLLRADGYETEFYRKD